MLPPLDPRIDLRAPVFASGFCDRSNPRSSERMSDPRRRFCFFLTHRAKAQAQNSKEAFQKGARTIVMSGTCCLKTPFPLRNKELRDDAVIPSIATRVSSLVIPL